MKKILTVLACLFLGIQLAALHQLVHAQKEIKLVARRGSDRTADGVGYQWRLGNCRISRTKLRQGVHTRRKKLGRTGNIDSPI